MIYETILKHGHWDSFINYLWSHTNWASQNGGLKKGNWLLQSKGNEEFSLASLLGSQEIDIVILLKKYFETLKNVDCLRCNKKYDEIENTTCQQCGWDNSLVEGLDSLILKRIIDNFKNIQNDVFLKEVSEQAQVFNYSKIEKLAIQFSDECNGLEVQIDLVKKEIVGLETEIANQKNKKESLEENKKNTLLEITQLEESVEGVDALLKQMDNPDPNIPKLLLEWADPKLIAKTRNAAFPFDLIMVFKPIIGGQFTNTTKDAQCFVILSAKDWANINQHEWHFDTSHLLQGKIQGEFGILFFPLHNNDLKSSIDSTKVKRIRIQ